MKKQIIIVTMRGCLYPRHDCRICKTITEARDFIVRQWKRLYRHAVFRGSPEEIERLNDLAVKTVEKSVKEANFLCTKNYLVRGLFKGENQGEYLRKVFNLDCEWQIFKRNVEV